MIIRIDEDYWFPDPYLGEDNGFFAEGGDLSVPRLLLAYANGIFPWYAYKNGDQPSWCCPIQRFVIVPSEIHISHSMRTLFNKKQFRIAVNEDFEGTLRHCMMVDKRDEHEYAWLGEHIIDAYKPLNRMGLAVSLEAWDGDLLMGGLYGVWMGRVFIGESMFSLQPNGSKIALIGLARMMERNGVEIIDCQCRTPHLESMGGKFMPYEEYIRILHKDPEVARLTRKGDNGFLYLDVGPHRCTDERRIVFTEEEGDDIDDFLDDIFFDDDGDEFIEDAPSADGNSR